MSTIEPTYGTPRRKQAKVSVIIPVYNAEKFLEECVDSVLAQSLRELEVVLVDDCSTDSSAEICERYAREDERVKVFRLPENRGPAIARNIALDYADGDYCTFVDADDKIHPDAYRTMYEFAVKNSLDIVRCEMGTFSDNNPDPKPIFHQYGKERFFRKRDELREMAVCVFATPVRPGSVNMNFGGSACSALHHRSLFEHRGVRFPRRNHMISEDFIFCYDCLQKARSVGLLPRMFYFYRRNLSSRSNIPRTDILSRAFATAELMEQKIKADGYPDQYQEFAWLYVIDITRAFVKNFFLSSMPHKEMKQWFYEQQDYPLLKRVYENFPLEYLPLKHRLNFKAFVKGRFNLLYALVKGRELLRRE